MTLRKLFFWFWTTLALGALSAVLIGVTLNMVLDPDPFGPVTQLLLSGSTFAAVAQLGFFSYLVFNWLAKGLVRSRWLYDFIQIILLFIVIGNLVYLHVVKFDGRMLWMHLWIPLLIVAVGVLVAWLKLRQTNPSAFIPTLFFMVTATTLEAIPSINARAGELPVVFIFFTIMILLVCNAWQILQLHRWVKKENKKAS
ncbi:KinB-signaling pathway activation protein [Lihuaxuella thermophila]|uniref:KinB signaling pathway activation protein n=1 Tax=Lihuaxuella thermophila TaxID=1173111 RepID=A0A1H8I0B6_9BACL|nr:KinB-signaling pathway activation protein [Lihuaxuella thermophila]SEN61802.1 KinB signaling pathway activation protein [Lihuaxuella thermophila]